jgi:hypothetical protein
MGRSQFFAAKAHGIDYGIAVEMGMAGKDGSDDMLCLCIFPARQYLYRSLRCGSIHGPALYNGIP